MKKLDKTVHGSEALIKTQQGEMATKEAMDMVTGGGDYLPRLQVMALQNNLVATNKISAGNLALLTSADAFDDMTNSVDVLVLAWKPKALKIDGDDIVESNDVKSDIFLDIKAQSSVQDSGCMYGPEVLIYIPSAEKYATFFMSSKSARRVAPKILALIGKAATIGSVLAEKKPYKWYAPTIEECTTPFEIPDQEEITKKIDTFLNPEPEEDLVKEDDKPKRSR